MDNNILLKNILEDKMKGFTDGNGFYGLLTFINKEQLNLVISAMKEACEKCIDICAEESKIKLKKKSSYGKYRKWMNVKDGEDVDLFSYECMTSVDKQSILNVKKRIDEQSKTEVHGE